MRARRWFEWHSWIGITAGLLLFVICWSGAVAVFSEELDWLLNPAERVQPTGAMRSWDAWAVAAREAYPDLKLDTIHPPRHAYSAAELLLLTEDGRYLRTYVNPYTAEVTGQTSYFNVQRFFRSLHMSFFDPGGQGYGYYFVMLFSFALLGSLITSLVFYKRWWQRFFAWKAHPNRRAFWSDTHKLVGLWSLWFVALMSITGLWYLLEFADLGFEYPLVNPVGKQADVTYLPLDELHARARTADPQLTISQMHAPGGFYGDIAVFHGEHTPWLVRDRANTVVLNAVTGQPQLVRTARDIGWPARWVDTADPLHFGNFGGLVSKTIWFVCGVLLSGLCLTGAYLHVKRQRQHRQVSRSTAVTLSHTIALLALVIATLGAVQEIPRYGEPAPPIGVWVFIAAWVFSTLAIVGAWLHKLR